VSQFAEKYSMARDLTSIIEREGDGYVTLCPEVDVASQGATVDEVHINLKEALELFFAVASEDEIRQRLHALQPLRTNGE
jgi:predicted RNase H-like HicB family nuclease